MKQTYKRILTRALALSLTLCLSVQLLPLAVLAEEGQSAPAEELTELLPEVPQEAGSIPSEPQPEEETPAAEPAPEEEPAEDPEEGLTPEEPFFEGLPVVMVEPVAEEPPVEEEPPAVLLAESTNTRTEDYYWEDQWFGTFTIDADTGYIIKYAVNLNESAPYEMHIPDTVGGVTVTGLSDAQIFRGRTNIIAVTMPDTVTYIGDLAFYGCSALTSVELSSHVDTIANSAFGYCSALTSITLPNTLTTLGSRAFEHCGGLTSITLPGSIRTMGSYLLAYCDSLISVTLAEGITEISQYAFRDTPAVTAFSLPSTLTAVGSSAFQNCPSLTSITFPGSVTKLGSTLFGSGCTALETVVLEEGITTIGTSAFANIPGAVTFSLPSTLTAIESTAFSGCKGMKAITLPENLTTLGGSAFRNCDALEELTIPGRVASMGSNLVDGCDSLTRVVLAEGVTEIGDGAFQNIPGNVTFTLPSTLETVGGFAFQNCPSLKSITFPGSVVSMGSTLFGSGCTALETVVLEEGITTIGTSAFANIPGEVTFSLPSTLTAIESTAFSGCKGMTAITLPENLTTLGGSAFYDCDALTELTIPGGVTSMGSYLVRDCDSLTRVVLAEGVTEIGYGAFWKTPGNVTFTLPDGLTTIGGHAFYDCTAMTAIDISDTVTSIGNSAFVNCKDLTGVSLPSGLTELGSSAFNGCTALTTIALPTGAVVGSYAFKNTGLTTVTSIPGTAEAPAGSIGTQCFQDLTTLTSVSLGAGFTKISSSAFENCTDLSALTLPSTLTEIGSNAFEDCVALQTVTFPEGLTKIDSYAFRRSGITSVTLPASVKTLGSNEVFGACTALRSADLSRLTVTTIPGTFMDGCTALASLKLNSGLNYINARAFRNTALTGLTIPGTVRSIGESAFENAPFTSLTFENGDRSLVVEKNAFAGNKLTSLRLPELGSNGYYTLHPSAFSGETLTTLTIGNNRWSGFNTNAYGGYAYTSSSAAGGVVGPFAGQPLSSVALEGSTFVPNYLFAGSAVKDWSVLTNLIKDGVGVTTIGYHAFQNCAQLQGNPDLTGITQIGSYAFSGCPGITALTVTPSIEKLGSGILENCDNLKTVTFAEGATAFKAWPYHGSYTTYYTQSHPFAYNSADVELVFEDESLTAIPDCLFAYCQWLDDLTMIPDRITSYGIGAFAGSGLTRAVIPAHVTAIGEQAFSECTSLEDVEIRCPSSAFEVGSYYYMEFFKNVPFHAPDSTETNLSIPADWTEIPDYLFRYSALLDTDFLTDVPVLTRLGTRSFAEMPVLERVTIPGTVTTIGSQAFYESFDCVSTLVIPESVTTLESTSTGTCQQFFTFNTTLRDVYIMNPDLDLRQADFELHVATPTQHGTKLVFNWKNYSDGEEYLTLHAAAASTAIGLAGASEGHYIFTALGEGKPITAVVKTPEGRDVTADCTFRWVNAQGNESTGSILYPATEGLTYTLYAELSEELLRAYPAPAARKVTSSGEAQTVEIVLGTLPAHTFTGSVTDEADNPLPGAAVTLIQQYNGIQTETDAGVTDETGAFTVTAFEAPSQVRVKLDDYYTGTAAVLPGAGESTAFETVRLAGLPATTILLNPVVTTADAAAPGPVTLSDLADLTFKVTREGDTTPLAHTIQDTTLVLTESVGIAEELELTVTNVKERARLAWSKTPIGFTLQQTQVDIPLTEYGRFSITAEDYNAASGQWVWVYDRIEGNHVGTDDWMGPLVAVYEMTSGFVQSEPLPAGDYRVVVIDKTCPFQSPASYYYLTGDEVFESWYQDLGGWLGMEYGVHFTGVDVTVTDGALTEAPIASVPRYAEVADVYDRFEDVFEKAEIGFSNASPIVGQDYYVWFDFSIKEEYRGRITTDGWHLDIYLPAHTRFNDVYPSYLGDQIVPQPNRTDTEGTQLIRINLPVGMQEGRYTFSLQGLARSPAASITFAMSHITLNGTPISQSFEIRDVKIDPGFDRSTELTDRTVTVTAPPHSYVTLYLDGVAMGTKKANNLGTADFTVTYPQPYYEGASWRLTAAYQLEENGELIDATDSVTVYYGNHYELGAVLDLPGDMPNSTINMNLRPRTGKVRYYVGSKDPYWSVTVDEGKQQYVKDGVITLWGFRDTKGTTYDVLQLQQVGDTNVFRGKPDDNFHYYSVAIDYDVTEAYREQQAAMPIQIPAAAYAEYEANLEKMLTDTFTVEDDPKTPAVESTEALDYQDVPATQYTGFDQLSEADQQKLLEADASYQAIFAGLQDASQQIAALFSQMPNWGWQGEMALQMQGYEVLKIAEEDLNDYIEHKDYTTYWMEDPTPESIKEYPVCVYTGFDKMEVINGQTLTLTRLRYTEESTSTYARRSSSGSVITSEKKHGLTKNDAGGVDMENLEEDCPTYNSIYTEVKQTADNAKTAMNIGADSVSVAIEQAEAWLEANRDLFENNLGGDAFDKQYVKLASSTRLWKGVLDMLPVIGNVLDMLTLGDLVVEQISADADAAMAKASFHGRYEEFSIRPGDHDAEECLLKSQAYMNAAIDYQNALANQTVSTSFQLVGVVASAIGLMAGGVGAVPGLVMTLGSTAVDWHLGSLTDAAKENLKNTKNSALTNCGDGFPPPVNGGVPTGPLHDPSGYIYEGVFSNRVEGVTASVWYQDENGDPVLWTEAASTGQDNPYTSHSDGYYGWVTPEGKWAVKFEKDGYEDADSRDIYKVLGTLEADGDGWLPVLPVQTEVHMPLESTAAPTVAQAMAYEDGVSLIFSQYMHTLLDETPATAAAVESHLSVTESGTVYSGSQLKFTWLDAEYSGHWYKKTFGSQLMVSRADGKAWEGPVTVAIGGAQNYAGTALSDWTSGALTVLGVPELSTEAELQVEFGKTGILRLTVEDAEGNVLSGIPVAAANSGIYAPVKSGDSATGSSGMAEFTVDGYYMGEDVLILSIPGRPETLRVPVTVLAEGVVIPKAPTVVIDGTTYTGQNNAVSVPMGTEVRVSAANGLKLYYSVGEDTCPCASGEQIAIENGKVILIRSGYYKFAAYDPENELYSSRVHVLITVKAGEAGAAVTAATPAADGLSISVAGKISNGTGAALTGDLCCAAYDGAGKLIGLKLLGKQEAAVGGEIPVSGTVVLSENWTAGCSVKLLFLHPDTAAPLAKAEAYTAQ